MKFTLTLLAILFAGNYTYAQIQDVSNQQSIESEIQASKNTLNNAGIVSNATTISVRRFLSYLNDNSSFNQLLLSFAVNGNNELYFITLAANAPASSSDQLTEKSGKEFSSEGRNGSIVNAGSNKTDQDRFSNGLGTTLNIKRYFVNLNEMRTKLQQLDGSKINNISVGIVSTQSSTGETFLGLVFQPENTATSNERTFSTFSTQSTRTAPSSGCPPFNCDY